MVRGFQHFEHLAHDAAFALDRLVRIGVGADRDGPRLIAGLGDLFFQEFRRIGLGEELGFEIEARRQADIAVRRPRETVDAAMLAAPIGVHGAVEGNVRRGIACDDAARHLGLNLGLETRQLVQRGPAVIEGRPRERLETPRRVQPRRATAPTLEADAQTGPSHHMLGHVDAVALRKSDAVGGVDLVHGTTFRSVVRVVTIVLFIN